MCGEAREDQGYERRIDNQLRKFIRDHYRKSRAEVAQGRLGFKQNIWNNRLLSMKYECFYCSFLQMYSCLGKGECHVLARSYVLAKSHTSVIDVRRRTLLGRW
jgi:hypothetical protein